MATRNCVQALRGSKKRAERIARNATQTRAFGSSAACQNLRGMPKFPETSSPELDRQLSNLRTKVFLPAALPKRQRDLITKRQNWRSLENNPLFIDLNEERFRLMPHDSAKDEPKTSVALWSIIALMKERSDWETLPSLLAGLKGSKRLMSAARWEKLARLASKAGCQDIVVECARRVSETGLKLDDTQLVGCILWWIQYDAMLSGWAPRESRRALSLARQIVQLLDDERHYQQRSAVVGRDPRTRPEVMGALLQLTAVRALRNPQAEDGGAVREVESLVEKLVIAIVAVEKAGMPLVRGDEASDVGSLNVALRTLCPMVHGMRSAKSVIGLSFPLLAALSTQLEKLELTVEELHRSLLERSPDSNSLIGLLAYERLVSGETKTQAINGEDM